MTQMKHGYLSWGLGGGEQAFRYGEDDYAGGSVATIEEDLHRYVEKVALSDAAIANNRHSPAPGQGMAARYGPPS